MTYLMRLNQINFGIITPEKDEPSGLNTYSAKHLCLLMIYRLLDVNACRFVGSGNMEARIVES